MNTGPDFVAESLELGSWKASREIVEERKGLRRTGSKLWRWKMDGTCSGLCSIPSVVVSSIETSDHI